MCNSSDKESYYNFLEYFRTIIERAYPTSTMLFIVCEENKKGGIHIHAFLCMRHFIDYNKILQKNILNHLIEYLGLYYDPVGDSPFDVRVNTLKYFKDVKN